MNTISVALKEWHLVIQALMSGRQAILLRKGGILESSNEFELEHRQFVFFPTYVHQNPAHTKPAWRGEIEARSAEPAHVTIEAYGRVHRIVEVPSRAAMDRLFHLHLWDTPLVDMRFAYRPEKPLYLVIVRAFRLPKPVIIENTLEYAGCKSWVPLERAIDVSGSVPALSDERIAQVTAEIDGAFAGG